MAVPRSAPGPGLGLAPHSAQTARVAGARLVAPSRSGPVRRRAPAESGPAAPPRRRAALRSQWPERNLASSLAQLDRNRYARRAAVRSRSDELEIERNAAYEEGQLGQLAGRDELAVSDFRKLPRASAAAADHFDDVDRGQDAHVDVALRPQHVRVEIDFENLRSSRHDGGWFRNETKRVVRCDRRGGSWSRDGSDTARRLARAGRGRGTARHGARRGHR